MIDMLRELHGHQAWADAEHWRAFATHPLSLTDSAIRTRLHHIHLVQRAFLAIVRGQSLEMSRVEDFQPITALRDYAREYHREVDGFLETVASERLNETLSIPWFKEPPIEITVAQAMTQATMHSHYHRGQNATRFRELGWEPPVTDLIIWHWKERPKPVWE